MKKISRRQLEQQIALVEEELDIDLHEIDQDYAVVKKYLQSANVIKILFGVAVVGAGLLLRSGGKAEHKSAGSSKLTKAGRVVKTLGLLTSFGKILQK